MQIRAIYIDGYGIFRDFALEGLSEGLNIIYGNNEAGKTTLMHFLNCTLFGFTNRNARDFHEPLKGGKHGGRLVLVTSTGEELTASRHTTGKISAPAQVRRADGRTFEQSALATLLGNLSKESFAQVFSFGLDELRQLDMLRGSALEAHLYSAGVTGRGRSLLEVSSYLKNESEKLFKPKGRKTPVNELLNRMADLEQEIAQLEEQPAQYQRLIQEQAELAAEIHRKAQELEDVQDKERRFQNLSDVWGSWEELQRIRLSMKRQMDTYLGLDRVKPVTSKIQTLNHEHQLILAAQVKLREDRLQADNLSERIAQGVARLGGSWSSEAIATFPTDMLSRQKTKALAKEVDNRQKSIEQNETELKREQQVLLERRRPVDRLTAQIAAFQKEQGKGTRPLKDQLEEAECLLDHQALLQQELMGKQRDRESLERELTNLRLWEQRQTPTIGFKAYLSWLALSGTGLVLFLIDQPMVAAGLVILGIAGALFTYRNTKSKEPRGLDQQIRQVTAAMDKASGEERDLAQKLQQVAAELARLSQGLTGEDQVVTREELRALRDRVIQDQGRLEELKGLRRELETAQRELTEVQQRLDQINQEQSLLREEYLEAKKSWQEWLKELGLPGELDLEGTESFFGAAREIQDLLLKEQEAQKGIALAKEKIGDHVAQVADLCDQLELPRPDDLAEAGEVLAKLVELSEACQALIDLEKKSTGLEDILLVKLGVSPEAAPGLWAELTELDKSVIDQELTHWQEAVSQSKQSLDQLRTEAGAIRERLQSLEKADELQQTRLEYNLQREELERLAQKWTVLNTCLFVLDKAKQRYEQEKQPAIMAKSSTYFGQVTGGRYRRVLKPLDHDGIWVETDDLRRLSPDDLSRGTLEELYLTLRLALVNGYTKEHEPLPLIMDDILVNMDLLRQKEASKLIAEAAGEQQVLFFTCHPEVVAMLYNQIKGSKLIHLESGELVGANPVQGELPFLA